MNKLEKLRIEISVNIAKRDLKKRWKEISSESRSAIRGEFGDWMNKSTFKEEDILFLDFFNDL